MAPNISSSFADSRPENLTSSITSRSSQLQSQEHQSIHAIVRHSELQNDVLIQALRTAVEACCNTSDPEILPKLMYTVMTTVEQNLHNHDSPLYGSRNAGLQEHFENWRAPLDARVDINLKIRPITASENLIRKRKEDNSNQSKPTNILSNCEGAFR
ncbi:9140_t:CDS:1 [Ambispora leptoticha]|uniref:9140_t:CDS:1 n=1 Tax=Ambispora leptoticha TaxID=144679 RepID=A0A9N9B200_9GLOM|nr:9140_t:CDS:1 [Ambispora leptoticha]